MGLKILFYSKPILYLFTIILLCTNCQNDIEKEIDGNNIIKAEIETISSRVNLEINEDKIITTWKDNDEIGLFGSIDGNNKKYTLINGVNTKKGEFASSNESINGKITAYYPFSDNINIIMEDNTIKGLFFPNKQKYRENSPDETANFMISNSTSSTLYFKNIFSIIRIQIKSNNSERINKIIFSDSNKKIIAGDFNYNLNNQEVSFVSDKSIGYDNIVLDCEEGILLNNNTINSFYIIVPSGYYNKGFSIEIVYDSNNTQKSVLKSVGQNGVTLHQSVYYNLPIIDQLEENQIKRNWGGFLLKGVTPESGWFDVNKMFTANIDENGDRGGDNLLCWIAASANILDWWQASLPKTSIPENAPFGAIIKDGKELPTGNSSCGQSKVFKYFEEYTVNLGGYAYNAIDWYLNKSKFIALKKKYEDRTDIGGFYIDIMGNKTHTENLQYWGGGSRESAINFFKSNITRAINNNYGINLNYSIGGGGHAITCWGYELGDEEIKAALTPKEQIVTNDILETNNGSKIIKYVYITDSDDASTSPENSLIRAGVIYRTNGDIFIIYHGSAMRKLTSIILAKFK